MADLFIWQLNLVLTLGFNRYFTIQYRATACNPRHSAYKRLHCFIAIELSVLLRTAQRHPLYLMLAIIVVQLSANCYTIKTSLSVSVSNFPSSPHLLRSWAGFTIGHWQLITPQHMQLLAVCYLTSLQATLLRAQPMRSETPLVIGWASCSLQAEVLGFSLWGRFVLLCSEPADILPSGGTDIGMAEKKIKWDWFYRWAEQTGDSLGSLAVCYLKRFNCLFLPVHLKTCKDCSIRRIYSKDWNTKLLKMHKHSMLGYLSF